MKLLKTIYLTRHGTTDLNHRDILQGHKDVPLNPQGRREARRLARKLKNEPLDHIYHSPLIRASETAVAVNRFHRVRQTAVDSFVEVDLGEWEMRPFSEVIETDREFYLRWSFDPQVKIPGGESFAQVCRRIGDDLEQILSGDEKCVLISAHATLNRAILAVLMAMEYQAARCFRMRNCGLSRFLVYGIGDRQKIILDYWNDTDFLGGSK